MLAICTRVDWGSICELGCSFSCGDVCLDVSRRCAQISRRNFDSGLSDPSFVAEASRHRCNAGTSQEDEPEQLRQFAATPATRVSPGSRTGSDHRKRKWSKRRCSEALRAISGRLPASASGVERVSFGRTIRTIRVRMASCPLPHTLDARMSGDVGTRKQFGHGKNCTLRPQFPAAGRRPGGSLTSRSFI
jgi:hypothetical protein